MPTTTAAAGENKKNISRAAPQNRKRGVIAALFALLLLFCAGGFSAWAGAFYNMIYPGVSIAEVDVSKYGLDDARAVAERMDAEKYRGGVLEVVIGNSRYELSADALEAGIDADRTAAEAYNVGRVGNVLNRVKDIVSAAIYGRVITPSSRINEEKFSQRVAEIVADVEEFLEYPYELREQVVVIRTQNMPDQVDEQELSLFLRTRLQSADFSEAEYSLESREAGSPDLGRILEEIEVKPQNASLDLEAAKDGSIVKKHVTGLSFDLEIAKKALESATGKTVEIPLIAEEPELTTEKFTAMLFRDTLSEVSTSLNPALVSRTSNVRLAASNTNGVILNPGDEYSFNGAVGKRLPETGFGEAKIFEKGQIVDGIGGGICQVSSTIYMAALRADLDIVERRNHQFTVTYAPLGQDATVVYGSTDFRFVNNTKMPVKLFTEQQGSKMYATIYGTAFENKTVELQTTVLQKTPYETKTVYDDTLEHGKTEVVSDGHTGYKTVTYRVVFVDGVETRRDKENSSTYTKLDFVTKVGTKGASQQTVPSIGPAETKPAETVPAETKPAETAPAETAPAETAPAETAPAETAPAETVPAETVP